MNAPRDWNKMTEEEKAEASAHALLQIPQRLLDLTEAMNALAASNEALANSVMELVAQDDEEDEPLPESL